MTRILLVDDDAPTRKQLGQALRESGFVVEAAASGEEAISRLPDLDIDVLLTDMKMGRVSGLEVLEAAGRLRPDVPVLLLTGHGSIDLAVEAMRRGAVDFLTKPVDLDRLELLIARAARGRELVLENRRLREELVHASKGATVPRAFLGASPPVRALLADIDRIASTSATVLILGESGTGKELVAERIHALSARAAGPLVRVNCAALAEGVLESELFGHEKGAYTGALKARRGRFEAAHGGTLFLDEIGDLSVSSQLKLLRVLQERTIERVGSTRSIPVDVRPVAATNRDLRAAVVDGSFREELYYRLSVVVLELPPLRDRAGDVRMLAEAFVAEFAARHDRIVQGLTREAVARLEGHAWPGNVRELRNVIESMVVRAAGSRLTVGDVQAQLDPGRERPQLSVPVGRTLAELEFAYIRRTLDSVGGNKSRAARILGIGTKTLYRKLGQMEDEGS